MSSEREANGAEAEDICVVCCKNTDIYAVGLCDHPVCYECSTRMRVLCKQNECPICRQDMPKVIFTTRKETFVALNGDLGRQRSPLQDRSAGLFFESPSLQKAYYNLLEHKCPLCKDRKDRRWTNFKNFNDLKEHMRKEHEMFYCDLCVANLKIFTSERRCYTRQELALHRRKGDLDNKSHRGHPLCEYCDTRYMDKDELFRHLRRDHFYCHFCDTDGFCQYYSTYDELRSHFLQDHFLCEEGNCRLEQFTSVFRTQIDLKAHQASVHSRDLGKSGTKQARTVEVAFTLTPRPGITQNRRQKRTERSRQDEEEGAVGFDNNNFYTEPGGGVTNYQQRPVDPMDAAEFPQLGGNNTEQTIQSRPGTSTVTFTKYITKGLSGEDFPTLGDTVHSSSRPSNVTITTHSKVLQKGMPDAMARMVKNQPNFVMRSQNFPSLGGGSSGTSHSATVSGPSTGNSTVRLSISSNSPIVRMSNPTPNVSISINNVPMSSTIQVRPKSGDFPALGNTTATSATSKPPPQWVQPKTKKQQKQNGPSSKVNPAPVLPPSSLSDFPVLHGTTNDVKTKKRSSVTVPVNSWVNLNSFNSENRSNVTSSAHSNVTSSSSNLDADSESNRTLERSEKKDKKGKKDQKSKSQGDLKKKDKSEKVKKKKRVNDNNEDSDNNTVEDVNKNDRNLTTNGVVKKLSELKIDTLINGNTEESPSISTENNRPTTSSAPPGFNVKPPPGFDNINNINKLLLTNDLTFTNSSGQSFPILPNYAKDAYRQPPNFEKRNENLIRNFGEITGDKSLIMEFKNLSAMFRQNRYAAEDYYRLCKETMGDSFDRLFPELLVLLPDISKQRELYKEHSKACGGRPKDLEVCLKCDQVLLTRDLGPHFATHRLENNFPILTQSEQNPLPNHWRK